MNKREILIDLSNLNKNISRSFFESNPNVPKGCGSPQNKEGTSQRYQLDSDFVDQMHKVLVEQVDDRVLHKRYLEERDFANKHPYLLNFSGDPFRQLHDART